MTVDSPGQELFQRSHASLLQRFMELERQDFPADTIETLAKMIGATPRTFFRLGYGFSRQRNGAVNMHAALSVAAVAGAWRHEGGGAFHNSGAIYHWDRSLIEGLDGRFGSPASLARVRGRSADACSIWGWCRAPR